MTRKLYNLTRIGLSLIGAAFFIASPSLHAAVVNSPSDIKNGAITIDKLATTAFGYYDGRLCGLAMNGSTDDCSALSTLVNTTLATSGGTVLISGPTRISADLTIPTNIKLWFTDNGYLTVDSGKNVVMRGDIEGKGYIFRGAGVVTMTGNTRLPEVYPQWWGAKANDGVDDQAGIQAACNAVVAAGGGIVRIPSGTYRLTTGVHVALTGTFTNFSLIGDGTVVWQLEGGNCLTFGPYTVANWDTVKSPLNNGLIVRGIQFVNYSGKVPNMMAVSGTQNFLIDNCRFSGFTQALYITNGCEDGKVQNSTFNGSGTATFDKSILATAFYSTVHDSTPVNLQTFAINQQSINLTPRSVKRLTFTGNTFNGVGYGLLLDYVDDVKFTDNTLYDVWTRGMDIAPSVHNLLVEGNKFNGRYSQSTHISMGFDVQGVTVKSNLFTGGGEKGVNAYYGVKDLEIRDNSFFTDNLYDTVLAANADGVIENNLYRGSNTNGANIIVDSMDPYQGSTPTGNVDTTVSAMKTVLIRGNTFGVKRNWPPQQQAWTTGVTYPANSVVTSNSHLYRTTAGGVAGASAPSHTSGSVSDGTVTWTFIQDVNLYWAASTTYPANSLIAYGASLYRSLTGGTTGSTPPTHTTGNVTYDTSITWQWEGRMAPFVRDDGSHVPQWAAGVAYTSGTSYVQNHGIVYKASSTGTSGASQPVHATGTVSDGTVSWAYVATVADMQGKNNGVLINQRNGSSYTIPINLVAMDGNTFENVTGVAGDRPDSGGARFAYTRAAVTGSALTIRDRAAKLVGTTDGTHAPFGTSGSGFVDREYPVSVSLYFITLVDPSPTVTLISGQKASVSITFPNTDQFTITPKNEGGTGFRSVLGVYPASSGIANLKLDSNSTLSSYTYTAVDTGGVTVPNATSKQFYLLLINNREY